MESPTNRKSTAEKEEAHSRTQFQVDRIAFFSDAVIAIAITLLILEIKIPPLGKDSTWSEIISMSGTKLLHPFISLFLCFVTVGGLWMTHHELFEHIHKYNKQLIKINLYFLLTVVLLPVSISFMQEEDNPGYIRPLVFTFNLFACNLTYYIMLLYVFHKKNRFSTLQSKPVIQKMRTKALTGTLVFFSMSLVALVKTNWFFIPIIAFPIVSIVNRIRARPKPNAVSA
jgi:uncharacterized membrane protein